MEEKSKNYNIDTDDYRGDLCEKKLYNLVSEVKNKLARQNADIPSHCDQFIIRCLRVKNYDPDKAAQLIRNFGTMMRMSAMQDLYAKFKPSELKDMYLNGTITPLLKRDYLGRLIVFARAGSWNPMEFDFDQALAAFIVLFNYSIGQSKEIQCSGVVFVIDCSHWTFEQLRSVKISRLKMVAKFMQNSCPGKIKGIHLINHPKVVSIMFALMKPFLKPKLASRIRFHPNLESLYNALGSEMLPEYQPGCKAFDCSITDRELLNDLLQSDEYCQDMVKHGYPDY